jgi:hypothetical protein
MNTFPAIPSYIHDPIVFYDMLRGLCMIGVWGEKDNEHLSPDYWLFVPINGAWVSQRQLTEDEIQNLEALRAKDIRV